jgi:predicted dehydrogenase
MIFVPKNLCVALPDAVSLEAGCYTTVGAIALHGVRQSGARLGETVVVIGLGLVGQLTAQILKAAGCRVLGIDIDPRACELALKSGIDAACREADQASGLSLELTGGQGADCVLITAGAKSNQPVELASELARDRARIVVVGLVGMDLPRDRFYAKELELRLSRSYGPGRYDPDYEEKGNDYPIGYVRWTEKRNMEAIVDLMAGGRVNVDLLTTHRFAIDQAALAYDLIVKPADQFRCGVVLGYGPGSELLSNRVAHKPVRAAPDEVGISFIGAGNFARGVLLPALKRVPKTRLVGIAAATGVSANNTARQFEFSYSTTEPKEILTDTDTTCVFIATRHDSHARLAAECLDRGKAVFVEKPLAIDRAGLRMVLDAAARTDGFLMVGYNRRFAPLAMAVKEKIKERKGRLSVVYRANAGRMPGGHWSLDPDEGGGRIIGEVCHFIDFIQYLTGALPCQVSAFSTQPASSGLVDDSAAIAIAFEDGSIGSIIYAASGDAAAGKERIEVFCDGVLFLIDDFKKAECFSKGRKSSLGGGRQDKGHSNEIAGFLEALRRGEPAPIGIESLAATSLATFGILESISTGNSVKIDARGFLQ